MLLDPEVTSIVPATSTDDFSFNKNAPATSLFDLNDAYLANDLRDSYLNRSCAPNAFKADSVYLSTDEYDTKACNIWRTTDITTYPGSTAVEHYTGSFSDRVS